MEAPAKFVPSDVLYWSRGRLGGWQLGCVCAVGIRVVRKNILHSAKGKRRRTFSPTCPSIRRHGGRGEVGVAELTASAGAEESCGKQVEIRGVPAGVRPRFTLEDQGRSTTSSSKRRHHRSPGAFKIELLVSTCFLNTGFREMDQDHSLVKKLNISIDLVVYSTIIIDKIRVASSPLVDNFLVTEDGEGIRRERGRSRGTQRACFT